MNEALAVPQRAISVYRALTDADIDCAIGGALALAYHVDDPRATRDVDVNITLPRSRAAEALAALPRGVPWTPSHLEAIGRDGQVRIMWPLSGFVPIPLDLFFAEHEFHEVVSTRTISVPMLAESIEILSASDLTVFKALFDRGKDWVDIDAMLTAHDSTLDLDEAIKWVTTIVGPQDPRTVRLQRLKPL